MISASPITSEAGEGGGGQVIILNQNCGDLCLLGAI